ALGPPAHLLAQGGIERFPRPVEGPLVEVVADTGPIGKVVGKQAPGAASLLNVQQSVDDFAQVERGRPPRPSIGTEQGRQQLPLRVGQVRRIGTSGRSVRHDRLDWMGMGRTGLDREASGLLLLYSF